MKQLSTVTMVAIVAIVLNIVLCTGSAQAVDANDPNSDNLFDVSRVLTLNITMDPCDWEALRFSCPAGWCGEAPHSYYQANLQSGTQGPMLIGIRRKNGLGEPNDTDPQKVCLKLDINRFVPGQLFAGKKKLSLESGSTAVIWEPALVSEGLSWNIYQAAGHVAGRSAWIKVNVNGSYKGLYSNVEQVDKIYLTDHGLDNDGFMYKITETLGEIQRTREAETSPFEFNWYPFDHPTYMVETIPAPNDWRDQTLWRVNVNNLLTLAVAENFIANTDGTINKMNNYWYYDWSTDPCGIDPNFQQPRLYIPWDLDVTMNTVAEEFPIMNTGLPGGNLEDGLINEVNESGTPFAEPTFQADYLTIYRSLLYEPLALSQMLDLVNNVEALIVAEVDADPYTRLTTLRTGAQEFQRLRDFLTDRTAYVIAQLEALEPPPPVIYLLDDGFEGSPWNVNWDGDSAWTVETTRVHTDSNSAGADRSGGGTGYFTSNALDAGDATAIHIAFDFQQDQAATFTLEYYNGTVWSTPIDLTALGGNHEWLNYTDTITDSQYFVSDFKIRFNALFSGGGTRSVEVDNVVVTKETVCTKANLDGVDPVNLEDFIILALDWREASLGLAGDITGNNVVDEEDLDRIAQQWLGDCGLP